MGINLTRSKHRWKLGWINKFAKDLNRRNIPSEIWFRELWQKSGMLCTKKKFRRGKDRFNYPINEKYIADVVNYKFMYVIEIDERYHEQPDRKRLDEIRDAALKCLGFNVFRIRAYNLQDFNSVVDSIRKLRFDRRVFSELNQDYAKYERKSKRVSCQSGNMLEL